jgi:choline kinase
MKLIVLAAGIGARLVNLFPKTLAPLKYFKKFITSSKKNTKGNLFYGLMEM